jgi:hypothetical protein
VAAGRHRQLAGNRREDQLDFVPQPNQYGYGNDRNKSQNQRIFDKRLTPLNLLPPVGYLFTNHTGIVYFRYTNVCKAADNKCVGLRPTVTSDSRGDLVIGIRYLIPLVGEESKDRLS